MDVELLCQGYTKFIQTAILEYEVSPLEHVSLPSMASKMSWKSFASSAFSVFSMSPKYGFLNEEIRTFGLNGGYTGTTLNHKQMNYF